MPLPRLPIPKARAPKNDAVPRPVSGVVWPRLNAPTLLTRLISSPPDLARAGQGPDAQGTIPSMSPFSWVEGRAHIAFGGAWTCKRSAPH